jgi:transposase
VVREGVVDSEPEAIATFVKLARYDAQVRRFMTAPGVGPVTALCFSGVNSGHGACALA